MSCMYSQSCLFSLYTRTKKEETNAGILQYAENSACINHILQYETLAMIK